MPLSPQGHRLPPLSVNHRERFCHPGFLFAKKYRTPLLQEYAFRAVASGLTAALFIRVGRDDLFLQIGFGRHLFSRQSAGAPASSVDVERSKTHLEGASRLFSATAGNDEIHRAAGKMAETAFLVEKAPRKRGTLTPGARITTGFQKFAAWPSCPFSPASAYGLWV